jgi:membrane protein DedA with SNARE-associated domain
MVSGMLKMKYSQYVVWNFFVGAVYVLSVGPAAYGAGKVAASEQDGPAWAPWWPVWRSRPGAWCSH